MRFLLIAGLCGLVFAASFPYREALPGYSYRFPRDHFEHEEFRTEWWYYTGNVWDQRGARLGFELVFFRNGERHKSENPSAWDVQQLYLAHAAVTDAAGKHFWYEQRLNRPGPGVAGASFERRRLWNGNWSAVFDSKPPGRPGSAHEASQGHSQTLRAVTNRFRFELHLTPDKPFVIQGENGISQKAEGAGHASYYISFPRLLVSGEMEFENGKHRVQGTAWMDHEWFTHQLASDQQGWDWFSIQLEDKTELMLFELRKKDGTIDPYSSGTFVDQHGRAHHLRRSDFELTPGNKAGSYPVEWRITVPSLHIQLSSKPILPNQELRGKQGGPTYWEGAVDYSGTQRGVGYLEMTGYTGAIRM